MHLVRSQDESVARGIPDLSLELDKVRKVCDAVLTEATSTDGLPPLAAIQAISQLVSSVTKLTETKLKCEKTVTAEQVNSLVAQLGQSVRTHVSDTVVRAKIQRDWLALLTDLSDAS